jgi:long-chain acyl-CoA synthetase
MSEAAPLCLSRPGSIRLGSVGQPVAGAEVEIVDVEAGSARLPALEAGEVRVKGPQLMSGYLGASDDPAGALRDGWLYTGDIGFLDSEGYLHLVGRKKHVIIVGGYNVYPREVDEVLFNHPSIREAATVGKRDARLGEVLVAFVVLADGEKLSEAEFFAYCETQMVKYKRPVEVHFVDALPKTGTNKINRLELRDRLRSSP